MPLNRKPVEPVRDGGTEHPLVIHDLPVVIGLSVLFPIAILGIAGSGASVAGLIVRAACAIPYIVFLPGYALAAALFPGDDSLTALERFGLSLGLSISLAAFSGYALNYTPWGIRLESLCIVLTVLILLFCGLAFYQRRKLPRGKRIAFAIRLNTPSGRLPDRKGMALWAMLALAVISTAAALSYGLTTNGPQERYTEFLIVEPDPDYLASPEPVSLGDSITVVLGVVNHEHQPVSYSILIRDCGSVREVIHLQLNNDQRWEQPVTITPTTEKEDCNISFLLFRNGDTEPYRSLFFWVTVQAAVTETETPARPKGN